LRRTDKIFVLDGVDIIGYWWLLIKAESIKAWNMIVDCHTHLNGAAGDAGTSEHLTAAETVDVCFVLAEAQDSATEANKRLSEYVCKHSEKMVGFAFIEPTKDKAIARNLDYVTEKLGLEGAVLYCSRCGFHPVHSSAMRFYELSQRAGVPVFFHNGPPIRSDSVLDYAQPFLLDEVARQFPALKIVIGSMGFPFVTQTLSMVAKHENVYADLSIRPGNVWQTYNTVLSAYEAGVMDKLLFGSGFPFGRAGECIETLLGFNKLLADTNLPTVPRGTIRNIIERDTLEVLGIKKKVLDEAS